MNNNIKLILFFILGIFVYVCLNKKLIEGYDYPCSDDWNDYPARQENQEIASYKFFNYCKESNDFNHNLDCNTQNGTTSYNRFEHKNVNSNCTDLIPQDISGMNPRASWQTTIKSPQKCFNCRDIVIKNLNQDYPNKASSCTATNGESEGNKQDDDLITRDYSGSKRAYENFTGTDRCNRYYTERFDRELSACRIPKLIRQGIDRHLMLSAISSEFYLSNPLLTNTHYYRFRPLYDYDENLDIKEQPSDWSEGPGKNCYYSDDSIVGARKNGDPDVKYTLTIDDCKDRCVSDENCNCITHQSSDNSCYLRSDCDFDHCLSNSTYDSYILTNKPNYLVGYDDTNWFTHSDKNCWVGNGAEENITNTYNNSDHSTNTLDHCKRTCFEDPECNCITYHTSDNLCYMRKNCHIDNCAQGHDYDTYTYTEGSSSPSQPPEGATDEDDARRLYYNDGHYDYCKLCDTDNAILITETRNGIKYNIGCTKCNNGTYYNSDHPNGCTYCPAGTTTPADDQHYTNCIACPNGTGVPIVMDGTNRRSQVNGQCQTCSTGYYSSEKSLSYYDSDRYGGREVYSDAGVDNVTLCEFCSASKVVINDGSECGFCEAGHETNNNHGCQECRPGTYREEGPEPSVENDLTNNTCTECSTKTESGTSELSEKRFYPNHNKSDCDQTCGPGEQVNNSYTGCEVCPDGHISNNDRQCTECSGDLVPNSSKTQCIDRGSTSVQLITKIFASNEVSNMDAKCDSDLCLYTAGNDYGCQNFNCESHNTSLNSNWTIREDSESEEFYTCNASSRNKLSSRLTSGVRCNKELCCNNLVCGHHQLKDTNGNILSRCPQGRMILYDKRCSSKEDCESVNFCCSPPIQSNVREIYDNILNHARYVKQQDNIDNIKGEDIRNFIYFSLIDLERTLANLSISPSDPITKENYNSLKGALVALDINNSQDLDKIILRDGVNTITPDTVDVVGFRSNEIFNEFLNSTRIINNDDDTPTEVSQENIKKFLILLDKGIENDILNRTPIDFFEYVDSGEGDATVINKAEFNAHF